MHPVLFQVAGLTIYSYGVCQQLSYAAFAGLLIFTANRLVVPLEAALRIGAGLLVGALAGGRLGFIFVNRDERGIMSVLFNLSGSFVFFTAVTHNCRCGNSERLNRSRFCSRRKDSVRKPNAAWVMALTAPELV